MDNLTSGEESCLIFAARYAHGRQTSAASVVVSGILSKWDRLSDGAKSQLKREAETSAAGNIDDWKRLIEHE